MIVRNHVKTHNKLMTGLVEAGAATGNWTLLIMTGNVQLFENDHTDANWRRQNNASIRQTSASLVCARQSSPPSQREQHDLMRVSQLRTVSAEHLAAVIALHVGTVGFVKLNATKPSLQPLTVLKKKRGVAAISSPHRIFRAPRQVPIALGTSGG